MNPLRAALPVLLVLGCGTNSAPKELGSAREVLARVRAVPVFAERFAGAPGIERRGDAYAVIARSVSAVRIELPARAAEPIRFVDGRGSSSVRALELATQHAELTDGALVYRDVAKDTDLLLQSVPSGVEELRVLRTSRAPSAFRWSVEHGTVRVVDGRIEILDEERTPRVRSEPPFAVDAKGLRRDLALRVQNDVLVAELDTTGLSYPIVVDPVWRTVVSTLPSPSTYYAYSWVTPNANTVLQLGGSNNVNDGTSWFDVPTEKWTLRSLTTSTRTYSNAIFVPSIGKTLIVGGQTGGGTYQNTAVLYDHGATPPATELSSTMSVGRTQHTLTLVSPGGSERVLVAGGNTGTVSVDWFDPSTSTFVARASMATARTRHAAIRLGSGNVLVTGGRISSGAHASGEVYDPAANAWTPVTNAMASARTDHTHTLLPDGRVLIVGGYDETGTSTATTTLYDPSTNAFSAGPSMGSQRAQHTATKLPDGRILVAGGYGRVVGGTTGFSGLSTTEIYDPTSNAFSAGPTMGAARYAHAAVALSGGRVMVGTTSAVSTTEILWPDGTACSGTSTTCPFCVDGVCCDTACTGQCEACDVAGKKGVCSPVNGEAPHGTRASCSPFAVCVYDPTKGSSACATACTADASCESGSYCVNPGTTGTCAPKKADGAGCTASNQCTSGFCVDGVCCKSSCTGQCDSCAEASSLGTCIPVDGMPRGTRTACTAPYACSAGACATSCTKDAECATGRACDTASKTCVPKKANGASCTGSSQCISGQCVDGTCCNTDCTSACFACDLAGTAGTCSPIPEGSAPHGTRTCAPYALCGAAGACKASCTSGADCLSGICDAGSSTCTAGPIDAGVETGTDSGTSSPDASADLGTASSEAPDPGPKPTVGEFIKCVKNSDCATGHCVEGVCCDTECTDRCHSCALLTSPGKCTLEPVGVDLRNECGPAATCLGTCDGAGQCIGAGKGTMCGRNRCTGATSGVGPAYCPGPGGKCGNDDAVPFECGPYVCEPAFGACASSCRSSSDCANGFACDTEKKTCVSAATAPDDSGCSMGRSGGGGGLFALLLLALLTRRGAAAAR